MGPVMQMRCVFKEPAKQSRSPRPKMQAVSLYARTCSTLMPGRSGRVTPALLKCTRRGVTGFAM